MKLFVLFLVVSSVLGQDFPPPLLGTASSRCFAEIETPIDIPADPTFIIDEFGGNVGSNPLQIPTNLIIRFAVNKTVSKIHYHFDLPALPADFAFDLTAFEITVEQDDGKLLFTDRFDPEGKTGIIPPTAGEPGSLIVARMVAIYEDDQGNEFQSEEVFFPHAESDNCCPLSHPPPKVFPETFDRLPVGPNDHFEGADFVLHKANKAWSWWCHNGVFKSCYVVPDGFVDTNLERFQEVGGVATFFDEDGAPARFECVFRPEGNDAAGDDGKGNRVSGNLSGEFVRLDEPVVDDLPFAIPGLHASECQIFVDSPIDIPADPTYRFVDPAHITGDQPFVFPPDTHVNVSAFNQADRFHAHWSLPEVDEESGLEILGYELTVREIGSGAVRNGRIISRTVLDPDVLDQHLDLTAGDLDFIVQASVVTIYTNQDNQQVRSAEQFFPKSTLDACPLNLPPPQILPDNYDIDLVQSETDGGFYTVTKEGKTWTYFCNNGMYKSCFHPPTGWDDPNNQRFQAIGGKALFRNIETGEHEFFVCELSEDGDFPVPFDGIFGEISGRFISVGDLTGDEGEVVDIAAGIKESHDIATIVLLSLCLILFVGLVAAVYTALHYRKKLVEKDQKYHAFSQMTPLSTVQEA